MPEINNLLIKVDILGIIQQKTDFQLGFVEVKTNSLNLMDIGQLWGYTKLVNPVESYLVSLEGLGTLQMVLDVAHRN